MTTRDRLQALILIVDRSDAVLELYETYLTFHGYRAVTATNGQDAAALAVSHRPALILMDLDMAAMTGTHGLQALRKDSTFDEIPIVAWSTQALEDQRVAADSAGFDEVIAKPCLGGDLKAAIDRLLNPERQSSS